MLVERYRTVVMTEYHLLEISTDQHREIINGQYPEFNLALFAEDQLYVRVGVRYGPVNVDLEVHESPALYDATEWEDAAEGDLFYDWDGGVAVRGLELFQVIPENEDEKLTPPGEHRYRVRIYARGKAIEYDGPLFGEPVEDYLIQMWPTTEPEPPRQMKNLSGV